jgi:pimeloyl-ACP methyl ester carboxylesterase
MLACPDVCALHPPVPPAPIRLEEVRQRYDREARQGICDTGRYRLRYYSWGEGPPLVFVHGVSDSSQAFLQPISRLATAFRCIAYDLPGLPGDGARLSRYRHADLVEDLFALLDHLIVKQSYLLGSSFGSTIALRAMQAQPVRLPRAIMQGGLAHRPLRRLEYALAQLGRWLPGRMRWTPYRAKIARLVNGKAFAERDEVVWRFFLDSTGQTPIATFAHQGLLLNRVDLRPILPQIRQPVLLVVGDRDKVTGPAYQQVLLEGLPNAGQVILEGAGHVPSYTHPEVLAEVVRQFLTPPSLS